MRALLLFLISSLSFAATNRVERIADNTFKEITTPAAPASGSRKLYLKSDGILYLERSTAIEDQVLFNPFTTAGDLLYGSTGGAPARLAAGTSGQYLKSAGAAAPSWQTTMVTVGAGVTADQSISNNTDTAVNFDNELYDGTNSFASKVFTAPNAGIYSFSGYLSFDASATGARAISYKKNGGSLIYVSNAAGIAGGVTVSVIPFVFDVSLAATDTIQIFALQTSGISINIRSGAGVSLLNIKRVGD